MTRIAPSVPPKAEADLRVLISCHGLTNLLEALAAITNDRNNPLARQASAAITQAAGKVRDLHIGNFL